VSTKCSHVHHVSDSDSALSITSALHNQGNIHSIVHKQQEAHFECTNYTAFIELEPTASHNTVFVTKTNLLLDNFPRCSDASTPV